MYYQYFGLTEAPFSIAVNPRYLFMSARHRDALAHLLYGVGAGGGFILLTGEVGTGKTTINRCLLEQLPQDTDIAIILNPALNAIELLASVCDELHIQYDTSAITLKTLTDSLHKYLLANHARGRKTVLMIDEAQHLDFDVLEQIRLLTNLETNSQKLLQIILIGQPELAHMLAQPQLRQLNQRITARYNLEPLNIDETGAYIHHRLQVAGLSPDRVIFPAAVVRGIHKVTRGIPRLINVLCDRILLGAYGRNKFRADRSMLKQAAKEVLGEQPAKGSGAQRRLWLVATLLLIVAGGIWYGWYTGFPVGKMEAQLHSPGAAVSRSGNSITPGNTDPAVTDVAAEAEVVAVLESASVTALVTSAATAASAPLVLLPVGVSMGTLWSLVMDAPAPDRLCPTSLYNSVACVEASAATWDELAAFDRPLSLSMITPERFAAEVLLLGIDGTNAWVLTDAGVGMATLAELAPQWTGQYHFLWHPPAGYTAPVALHDSSPVVTEVARLFAQLDAQPQPLATQEFTPELRDRVRLFQRSHGLHDDGVVGLQTLLKLNEKLGIDVTAGQARLQLESRAQEAAQP